MSKFFAFLTAASLLLVIIISVSKWYGFKNGCEDYLKLAGDAPSIEKAEKFLGKALEYMDNKGLTSGNSAFFFHTPSNDISIWYSNIKGAYEVAKTIMDKKDDAGSLAQIERSNALIKIRETVLDVSKSGVSVTSPSNITWYPDQWAMLIWWVMTIIFGIVVGIWIYAEANN